MTFKKSIFINYISAVSIFILVAAPTLKGVLFSSSLFNFLPLFLFAGVIIMQGGVNKVFKSLNYSLVPLFLFFLIMYVYVYVFYFGFPNLFELSKYIMLLLIVIIIPHAVSLKSLDISYAFLFCWGLFLALKKLFFGIQFTEEFHYLTLGFAIAVMIIISFFKFIYEINKFKKLLYLIAVIIGYASLLTLFGRSPLLFPTLLILAYMFFKIMQGIVKFKVIDTAKYLLILIGVLLLINLIVENYVPSYLLDKFAEMELGNEDSRTDNLYIPAFNSILSNPFGTGLGSSENIIGFYPHNIFLEIGIDSGFLGIIFFLVLIFKASINSLRILKFGEINKTLVIMVFLFWLIFLFWNVSYGLSSAYGLFSFLSLLHSYKFIQVNSFTKLNIL